MSLKRRCGYNKSCAGFPNRCAECGIVRYVQDDVKITKALDDRAKEILKENSMNPYDVTIKIGKQTYHASNVSWSQTGDDYPEIDISAYLSPHNKVQTPELSIKDIIFNPPATIVFWSDSTKTVVKARGEFYDPEKGIAMAISKKMLGYNKYEYYYQFEHWLKKWNKQSKDENHDLI